MTWENLLQSEKSNVNVDFSHKILFSALCLHISDFEVMSTIKIGLGEPKSDLGKFIAI